MTKVNNFEILTVVNNIRPQFQSTGFSAIRIPDRARKNGCSKPKSTSDQERTRNLALCSLLPKQDLQLLF